MSSKRKRQSYDIKFKQRAIEYAESSNNCAAAREFDVSEKMIRDWRKKRDDIFSARNSLKKIRHNDSPYSVLETDLNEWVLKHRGEGCIITRTNIRMRALQLAKDKKYGFKEFKATAGWCTRFMNRHNLTLRQRTHIAQKLPADIDEKVSNFHKFVITERKKYNYELKSIGNMDETPMTFDVVGNRTVHIRGEKTVNVRTTGSEKSHFTVVLACLADGTKLKPMLIFKRKTMPKEKCPPGVIVKVHPKGWMDEELVHSWLDEVWFKRPGALLNPRSLLVWDMFRAHLVDSVKNKLKRKKTYQAVIPGGCTSLLQPLDVSLNKPFKVNMRNLWNEWMLDGKKEVTAAGNLRRASIPTVCEWVVKAWDQIPSDMVSHSFKKCGISNEMDGSEDDLLYADMVASKSTPADVSTPIDEDDVQLVDPSYRDVFEDIPTTEEQFHELFGHSDDEPDFFGFDDTRS